MSLKTARRVDDSPSEWAQRAKNIFCQSGISASKIGDLKIRYSEVVGVRECVVMMTHRLTEPASLGLNNEGHFGITVFGKQNRKLLEINEEFFSLDANEQLCFTEPISKVQLRSNSMQQWFGSVPGDTEK